MRLLIALIVTSVVSPALAAGAAVEVEVSDLLESGEQFSGEEVNVSGELIGDYGFRPDGSMWTQLNGDEYAWEPLRESTSPSGGNVGIGLRMPAGLATQLDPPGGYRNRGPVVSVVGVWKYHDEERQGESFLEVRTLTVLEPGRVLTEEPSWISLLAGSGLLLAAVLIWWPRRRIW